MLGIFVYSIGNVEILGDTQLFFRADCRLTLLGESVADLLEILFLVRIDGRPTLLGGRVLLSLVLLCGEWRYLGYILQPNFP